MAGKTKNIEDAIMKSILDVFKEDALKFFGIKSKIITAARTESKNLQIDTSFMDYTFLLDDNSFLHLEFQTTNRKSDLSRFLAYDAVLYYKENRPVNTIVVYSSNVKKAETNINIGSIKYSVSAFYMNDLNGDVKYEYLKHKIQAGDILNSDDLLSLVFLPIMNSTEDKNERILESIKLAKEIKNKKNQMNCLALLYAFAEKFSDGSNMDKIKEVFGMTELGRLLREEGKEEGKKEGRREELIRTSTKLLTKKFGILPDDIRTKIENSDTTILEIIVDEILDFKKLEDIYKYLK
ncbi:DUF4351 domain-containing protein [Clostridium luticellarii]|uniref:DUF4351 domain-containing protein n=1 Tax=Clostridium luticellarii TaxID=1691940 RepID=A0A2T0BS77_9CLOT|nr:DUF4351 domain-containing protein [Clostridium luticellarii]PRR86665.1 hypothetical protein CLLU_04660 [Clostridium luticellarii]